jgi:hypothetical protein
MQYARNSPLGDVSPHVHLRNIEIPRTLVSYGSVPMIRLRWQRQIGFDERRRSSAMPRSEIQRATMKAVIGREYDNVPSPPPSDSVNGADYRDS